MIVLETPYFLVETDASGLIVCLRRSPLDYVNVVAMERDTEAVVVLLDQLGRDRKKLLVDLREGPRRNDPSFEVAMRRLRPRFFRGFRGAAVLVKTAVGALQVKRHLREDGVGAEVFQDEPEALEYLRGQSVRGEAPASVLESRRSLQADAAREDRISSLPGDRISSLPGDRISSLPGDWIPSIPSVPVRPPPLQEAARSETPPSAPAPPTRPSRGED